jgi:hypothetical protein
MPNPRNVRNFWFEADVDGRASRVSGGPVAKDGGMDLTLFVREHKEVSRAISIRCFEKNGTLTMLVIAPDGGTIACIETDRFADGMVVQYGDDEKPHKLEGRPGQW